MYQAFAGVGFVEFIDFSEAHVLRVIRARFSTTSCRIL